jgi:hypothetical protein
LNRVKIIADQNLRSWWWLPVDGVKAAEGEVMHPVVEVKTSETAET